MSKTQWECDLVERPFCEQLKAMGWQWIEGDMAALMTDLLTGRVRLPEVVPEGAPEERLTEVDRGPIHARMWPCKNP